MSVTLPFRLLSPTNASPLSPFYPIEPPFGLVDQLAYDARLVDIWACGIVYYCLHFQELPWRAAQPATDSLYAAYATACANPVATVSTCPPTINNLSPRACRSLIRKMLEPDPRLRSTIEDVVAHAWVKGIEICHEVKEPKHVHVSAKAMAAIHLGTPGH